MDFLSSLSWHRLVHSSWERAYVLVQKTEQGSIWRAVIWRKNRTQAFYARVYSGAGTFEEGRTKYVSVVRTPPGFASLLTPGTEEFMDLLLWVQGKFKLPDAMLKLPTSATPLSDCPYGTPFCISIRQSRAKIIEAAPPCMHLPLLNLLRKQRYERVRDRPKSWEELYPEDAWVLQDIMGREIEAKGVTNSDAHRVALVGHRPGMRKFRKARTCCGSHEWKVVLGGWILGKRREYLLGFNYGH